MLFNSYEFILLFLPLTLLGYFQLVNTDKSHTAITFLVGASLFYYAWWNPTYLLLIIGSILFNYAIGVSLGRAPRRGVLAFGIALNLSLLGYYKYFNFFIENINQVFSTRTPIDTIVLPLAISFFTFQQIAYLVDAYRGEAHEYNFMQYCLFVTFFPQLIAGPIVHHKEMMPQFMQKVTFSLNHRNMSIGIALFSLGLFKKIVIADNLAPYATDAFNAASYMSLTFLEAWRGALAYTFQLYFDFSGYSDMAIGIGYMFGIRLPFNFNSPYKATSIIDFWSRWHMTLSRFLRHYVYFPLGGNRYGKIRHYFNLMITMLLGGLWHGAGWTFVLWGALHGIYLALNHAWRAIQLKFIPEHLVQNAIFKWLARILTFAAVTIGWVFFRAKDTAQAIGLLKGMLGLNGLALTTADASNLGAITNWLQAAGVQFMDLSYSNGLQDIPLIGILLSILWLAPNSQEIIGLTDPEHREMPSPQPRWQATKLNAVLFAVLGLLAFTQIANISEFLYFQF